MDWIDINNKGISHFSLHPHLMMRDDIHFDIFHLRCAIPRRMMNYLRKFMMKTTTDLMKKSTDSFLTKNWSNHNVLTWNLNKPFTSFIGCELLLFIKNILLVVQFLKDNFQAIDLRRDLYNGLLSRCSLTKYHSSPGYDETFYMHVMRYYMPMIVANTLNDHQLGLGIFKMQGYEHRNKESKNTLNMFPNTKGNVLCANLRRLCDIFYYKQNSM